MLHYRIVEKTNPAAPDEPGKYYARLVNPGVIDVEGLAKRISSNCTVTRSDTLAVLSALQEQVIYALQNGMRVHLGDLGNLRLSCQSEGVENKEDFKTSMILKLKVQFTPNKTLKEAVARSNQEISFYQLDAAGMETGAEAGTDEGGGAGV